MMLYRLKAGTFRGTHFVQYLLAIALLGSLSSCKNSSAKAREKVNTSDDPENTIITAAEQTDIYLPLLKNKAVAIVTNHTGVIFKDGPKEYTHLVDSLVSLEVNVVKVFAPEHGFRGKTLGGEHIIDNIDKKTGVPIKSVYGESRKPSAEVLEDVDIILFDIQDVGVRFYTYISTMSNVMEAAAENDIPVIVLDRPNPNGHIVDGPMLDPEHRSFVGMHPVPLVYGMTIGEYALMVNGEQWLKDGIQCDLTVIPLDNYSHQSYYHVPIAPSPNLPNDKSINLYASLGFFEGTVINEGRGTDFQFQRYGASFFPESEFSYTPQPNAAYKNPKFNGQLVYGVDLYNHPRLNKVDISFLVDAYQKTPENIDFFNQNFTRLSGGLKLRVQLEAGMTAEEIMESWQEEIEAFGSIREKYLLYD